MMNKNSQTSSFLNLVSLRRLKFPSQKLNPELAFFFSFLKLNICILVNRAGWELLSWIPIYRLDILIEDTFEF